MFLSKVKLTWAQSRNPYEQHGALWKLFPEQPEKKRDFLFRIEQLIKGQGAYVLMQSLTRPVESEETELLAVRDLNLPLQKGQQLRFCLRANPIKSIKDESKGTRMRCGEPVIRHVRVPLLKEDQQQDWLIRKMKETVIIDELRIQQELPLNFFKPSEKRRGKIRPVLFEGVLTVENAEAFITLMREGIGPAKGFGCGMLSIATL